MQAQPNHTCLRNVIGLGIIVRLYTHTVLHAVLFLTHIGSLYIINIIQSSLWEPLVYTLLLIALLNWYMKAHQLKGDAQSLLVHVNA